MLLPWVGVMCAFIVSLVMLQECVQDLKRRIGKR